MLEKSIVIQINQRSKQSWKDIMLPYLPKDINKINIYDRYIRNHYQFKSLEMFIDAILINANKNGLEVKVTTTAEDKQIMAEEFRLLESHYRNVSLKLEYNIIDISHTNPHFRRAEIESMNGTFSIWLDRGLDIFIFSDYKKTKFETRQTYVVIEQKNDE